MPIFTQIMTELEMRTTHTRIIALIFAATLTAINAEAQDIIYEKEDSIFIEETARKHPAGKYATTGERITAIAKEFIGKDYVAGTLDEYSDEPLFISTSRLDCSTFVELVLAIAVTEKEMFDEICNTLEQIRYRNGVRNGYTSRLHYMSWWITDPAKKKIISETETPQHTAVQRLNLNFMSRHPESYRHLKEYSQRIQEIVLAEKPYRNIDVKYIPKANIKEISGKEIKNGDILAIVTATEGLDVSHVGFAYWENDELHMIHASSTAGKIMNDSISLDEYLGKRKKHLGIRVFRAL